MRLSTWIVGSMVAIALVAVGCARRGVPLRTSTPAVIAGAYELGSVRAALVRALERERFQVVAENGPQLTATYTRGRRMLHITVTYDLRGYQIQYVQSVGFGVRQDESGVSFIHPLYDRIVRGLHQQVRAELERPVREHRRHELQVARAQRPTVVAPYVAYGYAPPRYGYVQRGYGGGCEVALAQTGHARSSAMFCRDAEPACAEALIYTGHAPSALMFCRGVDPACAVAHLESGGAPVALGRCR